MICNKGMNRVLTAVATSVILLPCAVIGEPLSPSSGDGVTPPAQSQTGQNQLRANPIIQNRLRAGESARRPSSTRLTHEQVLAPMGPVQRVAQQPAKRLIKPVGINTSPTQQNEHPLMPALRWAQRELPNIRKIQDYQCTFVKRERDLHSNKLGTHEYIFLKVRHQPLSVYMYFLGPPKMRGREVIYIKGANNGKLWAHPTGVQKRLVGTISLAPTGTIAMKGNRYPITEVGMLNLTERLIEIGERDTQYGECDVKFFDHAQVNGTDCTCIQVVHPVPRRNFLFYLARIYIDNQMQLPVRYESFGWPKEPGGPPQLLEEYTYLDLKVNNGFTNQDFDVSNPNYKF